MEDKMRALVLGVATLALSAGAALAQAPAQDVYPGSGYAPFGYGYVPYGYAAPAPMFDYSGPAYGYSAPGYGYSGGPAYGYSAPGYGYSGGPTYDYSGPAYGAATGQPPGAGETAENPPAGSVPTQTVRHHRSVSASGSNSSRKGDLLKSGGTNGGY